VSCARALLELDGGEPIAVLGCMRELGSESASLHEAVGRALRQIGISRLWVYGDFAMDLARGFGPGASDYENFESLRPALAELPQGSRILVKGSRYWMSERVVEYLLNQFGGAEQADIKH